MLGLEVGFVVPLRLAFLCLKSCGNFTKVRLQNRERMLISLKNNHNLLSPFCHLLITKVKSH